LEGGDQEHHGSRSAKAKSSQDPISTNKKLVVVAHDCHPSYMGSINRRITVQAGQGISERPYLKNKQNRLVAWLKW
jgi:hypothetical protein